MKFFLRYIEQIPSPTLDINFSIGKNIHALASYFLKRLNIEKFEKALSGKEVEYWNFLKGCRYFNLELMGIEKSVSMRLDKYWIGGRMDAIVKENNDYYILDYKTGGVKDDMKYDPQTMIYLLLCKNLYKDYNSINFVYIDVKNKKEVIINLTDELKSEYEKRLLEICNKMHNIKPTILKPSQACKCEYSKACEYIY
ncbi:PD-(D/E)XK nuclease family protein [bacterium]|nr:PD-(D/E)XK nuclease family protein [bacterium]